MSNINYTFSSVPGVFKDVHAVRDDRFFESQLEASFFHSNTQGDFSKDVV